MRTAPVRLLFLAVLLAPLLSSPSDAGDSPTWYFETVTLESVNRDDPSLVHNSIGIPYIAFFDDAVNDLTVMWKQNAMWHVDTASTVDGRRPSIAMTSDDKPVIAYYHRLTALRYTFFVGNGWIDEFVDPGDIDRLSLALGPLDEPHIAYRHNDSLSLAYARRGPGGWVIEHIVTGTDGVRDMSIAVDSSGDPHIVYVQNNPFQMRYAKKSGGIWTFETVDDTGTPTVWARSLAVDSGDVPHLAYSEAAIGELAYGHRTGGVWSTQVIDALGGKTLGQSASLVLDASDKAHIGHLNFTDATVRYATNSSGFWVSTEVTQPDSMSNRPQIAMDPQGNLALSGMTGAGTDLVRYGAAALSVGVPPVSSPRIALRVVPTPAPGGRATVSFTLGTRARARISVVDAMGRSIRALSERDFPAGPARIEWNGLSDSGAAVEPGVYFVRLEVNGEVRGHARTSVLR